MKKINTVTAKEMVDALGADSLVLRYSTQEYTDGDGYGDNYYVNVEILKAKDLIVDPSPILEIDGKYYMLGDGKSGMCGYGEWGTCYIMVSPVTELKVDSFTISDIWMKVKRPVEIEWLSISDECVLRKIVGRKNCIWQSNFVGVDCSKISWKERDELLREKIKTIGFKEKMAAINVDHTMYFWAGYSSKDDIRDCLLERYNGIEFNIVNMSDDVFMEDEEEAK